MADEQPESDAVIERFLRMLLSPSTTAIMYGAALEAVEGSVPRWFMMWHNQMLDRTGLKYPFLTCKPLLRNPGTVIVQRKNMHLALPLVALFDLASGKMRLEDFGVLS